MNVLTRNLVEHILRITAHEYTLFPPRLNALSKSPLLCKAEPVLSETLWKQLILPPNLVISKIDVILYTYPMVALLATCPGVAVIYDMLCHAERSERSLLNHALLGMLKLTALRSKRIITISNFSKNQIVRYLGVSPQKVVVAYPGCDNFENNSQNNDFKPFVLERSVGSEYFLSVLGAFPPRKNAVGLLQAYATLPTRIRKLYKLILVARRSGSEWRRAERLLADRRLNDRVVIVGDVSEQELLGLYRNATLFLHLPLYEGFSLPVVEAMSCGIPVIATDRAAIPEIVGNSALLVDPANPSAVAKSIVDLLESPSLAKALSSSSIERSRIFSWMNMAKAVSSVLVEAASS